MARWPGQSGTGIPMSLQDIADEAGVSIATVSRVINNTALDKVSERTRLRVLEIARRNRFRPNSHAVSLAQGRPPSTIGLVLPYHNHIFDSYYFSQFSASVADVAAANRMDINLLMSREASGDTYLDYLSSGRVAGAILLGTHMGDDAIAECKDARAPFVVINNVAPAPGIATVTCNNRAGARDMMRHLLRLGHRRIGFIAGPPRLPDAHERLLGYRDALEDAGIPVDERLIVEGEFSEKVGREGMRALLARLPRPTAVFAANDESAIGAMQALKREGLRVPHDMAVAGFDDIQVSQYVEPALTTVHQPFYRMGQTAAELLIARIKGAADPSEDTHHVIRTRLVIRESCGARSHRI